MKLYTYTRTALVSPNEREYTPTKFYEKEETQQADDIVMFQRQEGILVHFYVIGKGWCSVVDRVVKIDGGIEITAEGKEL